MQKKSRLQQFFESFLWNFRYIIILVVICLLIASLFSFYLAIHSMIEGFHLINSAQFSDKILVHIISALDEFLLGIIIFIFALGIYELFMSKIDMIEQDEIGAKWLSFHSLDELKSALVKVLIIILIVYFFKSVALMQFTTPLSILYLAAGIILIAVAQYLSGKKKEKND